MTKKICCTISQPKSCHSEIKLTRFSKQNDFGFEISKWCVKDGWRCSLRLANLILYRVNARSMST